MLVKRLPNGNLLVPARADSDDGVIGDGVVELGPDDPDYDEWVRELERQQAPAAPPPGSSSGRPAGQQHERYAQPKSAIRRLR